MGVPTMPFHEPASDSSIPREPLTFGSVCSGIEAASAAWLPLGWRCAFMSEIEAFPRAVLTHHYPETPLHGDFTTIQPGDYERIDALVGGTPCQSFSVAGLRGGMADDRGNLALQFLALAGRLRPEWVVWENVPGVLSSNGGRDFGSFLGGLGELGYGWAYRTLDAQFFGVAQRRRRVFVVGHAGDWRCAAAVLFERHCLSGHPAPSREAGQRVTGPVAGCSNGGGANGPGRTADDADSLIAPPLTHNPYGDHESREGLLVTHSLRADRFDASEDGTGRGTPLVVAGTLTSSMGRRNGTPNDDNPADYLVAFSAKDHGTDAQIDLSPTLRAGGHTESHANAGVMPAIAYGLRSDLDRPGEARRPSVDATGKARLRDAGFNPLVEQSPTLDAARPHAVAFALRGREGGAMPEVGDGSASALRSASGGSSRDYVAASSVRRLTPRECERLQGFPDDFTAVPYRGKPAADGPRYKALGNSMAVPVMAWIGRRIAEVDARAAGLATRPIADGGAVQRTATNTTGGK